MTHSRYWIGLLILAALALTASAQGQKRRDVVILYKDGFFINGKVKEQVKDLIFDSKSGMTFPVFSGDFSIDDEVRDIRFGPGQVLKIIQRDASEVKEPMKIELYPSVPLNRYAIYETFKFEKFSPWDDKGERKITVFNDSKGKSGYFQMEQKFAVIRPHYVKCITDKYEWDPTYFPQEFGPELMHQILERIYRTSRLFKGMKESDKALKIAGFMQEAGWFNEAEKDLLSIIKDYPSESEKKTVEKAEEMLARLRTSRADLFAKDMEMAALVGQHDQAIERLERFARDGYQKLVSPDFRIKAQDLKLKYEKAKTDLEQVRAFLKELPALTQAKKGDWTKASEFILDELNHDTVDRLEEFLKSAQQFELERKQKRELSLSAEEVLTIGISSWLQGKTAFEKEPKVGLMLLHARAFLVEYLLTDDTQKRANMLSVFKRDNDLPIDMLARLIRNLPPIAHDAKLTNTKVQTIALPEANGGSYLLQLPPGYHPQRAYPVLMLLHGARYDADDTIKNFSEEAAKRGFILAAPLRVGKVKILKNKTYEYSEKEHMLALETLRDLRRRFQVDSDRVFLFGWEDGANMAFDVGLGHPDLFAGVAPMCGSLTPFARRFYWPNAQYLPFYVVDGSKGGRMTQMKEVIKEWTREPYASLFVEYKGRGSEWFGEEIPKMLHWMSCKKRYYPNKELGRQNNDKGLGEEFHSTRSLDNRFYWLSSDSLLDRNSWADHMTLPKNFGVFRPATFQANLSKGNKSDKDGAKIWNQIQIRVNGAKQVTFWITHDLMDLKDPLKIYVNGDLLAKERPVPPKLDILLEELHQTGDRQRLYVAKVDIKLVK